MTLILGIETSCDETAAAVVADGRVVRSNVVASQHELHATYGGVVPEIASRAHVQRIEPVVRRALDEAGVSAARVDAVAVGNRPGLIGSLLVGVSAAQALAWALGRPLIGVDHVHAHLYAAELVPAPPQRGPAAPTPLPSGGAGGGWARAPDGASTEDRGTAAGHAEAPPTDLPRGGRGSEPGPADEPHYPALGLVVSGGHTSLYAVRGPLELELLGRTIDDAVGEAYDKAAVILEAGYPGGPRLDGLAQRGDGRAHELPRSMLEAGSLDFSFSGLKTALLYAVRGRPVGRGRRASFPRSAAELTDRQRADFAASFQEAVVDVLIAKIERALAHLPEARRVVVGGGVSANSLLRKRLGELGERRGVAVNLPELALCVDNAAMIAGLAHARLEAGQVDGLDLPAVATGSG